MTRVGMLRCCEEARQIRNRNFTIVSGDRHAQSYIKDAAEQHESQFYYSFVRSTRTILCKGCCGTARLAILLQFRAIDTHDPIRKGCRGKTGIAILLQFRASTRTILCKDCIFASICGTTAGAKKNISLKYDLYVKHFYVKH